MQRVTLLSFGFMGTMHAQIYQQLPDATLVGVVEQDAAKARAGLEALGICAPVFPTLRELLAQVETDVVDICLPTYLHREAALEAIQAGKHVFCEKPIALTLADAQAIEAAARGANTFFQVGQCIRFWPEYQAFSDFVASREAGALLSLSLQRRAGRPSYSFGNWLNQEALSGGAALDLHIHDTDFVLHLLGTPEAVTSQATVDASGPSHIFTQYRYPGVAVTAEGGWNYPEDWGFQMAFSAVFEKGAVEFDSAASPTLVYTPAQGGRRPLPFAAPGAGESKVAGGNVSSLGGYYNELAYFIRCLETRQAPGIATAAQATESLRTVLAELESAWTRATVSL